MEDVKLLCMLWIMIFNEVSAEGVLLVDATNAFNCIYRQASSQHWYTLPITCTNHQQYIPISSKADYAWQWWNSFHGRYHTGRSIAMAMYAIAVTPTICHLRSFCQTVQQAWYADDAAGAGSCDNLKMWWDELNRIGPLYGYYPNASKTCLLVKPHHEHAANEIFAGSGITISTKGNRHLGAALGSRTFVEEFVSKKVANNLPKLLTLNRSPSLLKTSERVACLAR